MIPNLKALIAAGIAVLALGAIGASAAQAHIFTAPGASSGEITDITITPDGSGKAAHHVFDIFNASRTEEKTLTCNKLEGHATVTGPSNNNIIFHPEYSECVFIGVATTVSTTGCNYNFSAEGEVTIECGISHAITWEAPNCHVEVPGGQTLTGISYHVIEPSGIKEITVSMLLQGITFTATGIECPYGTQSNGEYTTGNSIFTGEIGSIMVPVAWD